MNEQGRVPGGVPQGGRFSRRLQPKSDLTLDDGSTQNDDGRELVRIGELAEGLGMPVWTVRRMADSGTIPSVRSDGGHRLFNPSEVRAALGLDGNSTLFTSAVLEPSEESAWQATYPLDGLEEDLVWRDMIENTGIDHGAAATHILEYSMAEMINNAIDHSGGTLADVRVWSNDQIVAFRVQDNGEGAFAHLRKGLGLADDFEAIAALTKGRQTTWRERHTGEGIFFTSKMNELFQIQANGKRWIVDNLRGDQAVGTSPVTVGTVVYGQVDAKTTQTSTDVFKRYVDDDFAFTRTRPSVKLAALGMRFASRSEARRFLNGLDDFTEIDIDFNGVTEVGQGFVDEVFRVWSQRNPGKAMNPINMNDAVAFMVKRGLRPR